MKCELFPNSAPPHVAHLIERANTAQPFQPGTSLKRLASNLTIRCVSSPAFRSSSKEWIPARSLCYLRQTWFHFQFGLPWRTPFVTMLVPNPTSSDDKDAAGAVTMWNEVLTLATVSLWARLFAVLRCVTAQLREHVRTNSSRRLR